MNIIRTKVVELNVIPAIAYKIKLSSGGSGVKLHRTDLAETAFAELDKRTGGFILDKRVSVEHFPEAAFDEAMEILAGMPFSARGNVKVVVTDEKEPSELTTAESAPKEVISMVDSDEFNAVIERYSDETGKINYQLMNKQFIQFAAGSKTVADLCANKVPVEDILVHIVKNRAAYLAGKKENITDEEAIALIEIIDEIDPRSAFKELTLYIRKRMAR